MRSVRAYFERIVIKHGNKLAYFKINVTAYGQRIKAKYNGAQWAFALPSDISCYRKCILFSVDNVMRFFFLYDNNLYTFVCSLLVNCQIITTFKLVRPLQKSLNMLLNGTIYNNSWHFELSFPPLSKQTQHIILRSATGSGGMNAPAGFVSFYFATRDNFRHGLSIEIGWPFGWSLFRIDQTFWVFSFHLGVWVVLVLCCHFSVPTKNTRCYQELYNFNAM